MVCGSPRDIRQEEWVQKPLIFMCFHEVSPGSQHEIWSKQHNGKVSILRAECLQAEGMSAEARTEKTPDCVEIVPYGWRLQATLME